MEHTLQSTLAFAAEAHRKQTDKGGKPYFEHVLRVHQRTRAYLDTLPAGRLSPDEIEDILNAASLHDVFEDSVHTGYSLVDLDRMGFRAGVVRRVKRLCGRPDGVSYLQNIERMVIEGDLGTILIKLADNDDNSDPARIAQLPPDQRSIAKRYERSKRVLHAAYVEALTQREDADAPR